MLSGGLSPKELVLGSDPRYKPDLVILKENTLSSGHRWINLSWHGFEFKNFWNFWNLCAIRPHPCNWPQVLNIQILNPICCYKDNYLIRNISYITSFFFEQLPILQVIYLRFSEKLACVFDLPWTLGRGHKAPSATKVWDNVDLRDSH